MELLLLLHVPPETPSEKFVVVPTQMDDAPETLPALGNGLTVRPVVAVAVPHELVTV